MCDYETGDKIPGPNFCTYQVEICGGMPQESKHSCATIKDGLLDELAVERDESLPLLKYLGTWNIEDRI